MNLDTISAHGEFPASVLEQARAAARMRTSQFLSRRLDLRGKTLFALTDGPDHSAECAYSITRNQTGWQLGIHITDVCEFVCEGSPLDTEALSRLTSIRTQFGSSEMLPEIISKDLCDLSKSGDKLAISVLLDVDCQGNLLNVQFEESVVRVAITAFYNELEQLATATDASSVMHLRQKYLPFMDMITEMYELAAMFCVQRRNRGGLDCTYFKRVYERDGEGKITSFRRESEPDTRAMIREIGYFTAEAVGKYMIEKKLPCIFNGRDHIPNGTLNYLSHLVGENGNALNPAEKSANIADKAKGSPYYGFVCDTLAANMPRAEHSDKPIFNSLCATDSVVSFFRPASRYTDLLIQRILKTNIIAKNPKNLNLNRQLKVVGETAAKANTAEEFISNLSKRLIAKSAREFVINNPNSVFVGFPAATMANGDISVFLECAAKAVVPKEYAAGYDLAPAYPADFSVISYNAEDDTFIIKPI